MGSSQLSQSQRKTLGVCSRNVCTEHVVIHSDLWFDLDFHSRVVDVLTLLKGAPTATSKATSVTIGYIEHPSAEARICTTRVLVVAVKMKCLA